jgi:hypothetical protein
MTKNTTIPTADELHRGIKMALDSGEVASLDEAVALFRRYRLSVAMDAAAASTPAGQAALLTAVNCGRRSMLGGIAVAGPLETPLLLDLPGCGNTLRHAVESLGGEAVDSLLTDRPALLIGERPGEVPELSLVLAYGAWRAGVVPVDEEQLFDNDGSDVLAAMVAGAIGVAEMFQNFRGFPVAGRRRTGISLWDPADGDWERAVGPKQFVAPSHLWLIGLGHLGQAFLWALGLLPFAEPHAVELTLQDFDKLTKANDSTSVLTDIGMVGKAKTRAMSRWAEQRGFLTRMVERRFAGDVALQPDDPRVALCGVDNPEARALLEEAGFDLVVEAGLGAGPEEYCAIRMHCFPGASKARALWSDEGTPAAETSAEERAYRQLAKDGMDECGLVTLASRTVGAPFVGTIAAGLVIAEIIRRLNGGDGFDVIDITVRAPEARAAVRSTTVHGGFNPGFAELNGRAISPIIHVDQVDAQRLG